MNRKQEIYVVENDKAGNEILLDKTNLNPLHLLDVIEEYRQQAEDNDCTQAIMSNMCMKAVAAFCGFSKEIKEILLDRMGKIADKARLSPPNYPVHHLNRLYAALVAEYAGFTSRAQWTEVLKKQKGTFYNRRIDEDRFHI